MNEDIAPDDPRFPLGVPLNRNVSPVRWVAIPGRPHWFRNNRGEVRYFEPVKETAVVWVP